jgi:hypothetical protein
MSRTSKESWLRRQFLVRLPLIGLFLGSGAGMTRSVLAAQEPKETDDLVPEKLLKRIKDLEKWRLDQTTRDAANLNSLSWLSQHSPPIGSIVAFGGTLPDGEPERHQWEQKTGWILCDGRPLSSEEYASLREVVGDKAPDYRAVFLRGINTKRDGSLADKSQQDEDGVRSVNHFQDFSTALPKPRLEAADPSKPDEKKDVAKFVTNEEPEQDLTPPVRGNRFGGENSHFNQLVCKLDSGNGTIEKTDTTQGEPNLYDSEAIKNVPAHKHTVDSGGNAETRPINCAVYWIIKYRATPLTNAPASS